MDAKALAQEFSKLESHRSGFTGEWQDIIDLVRPYGEGPGRNSPGANRTERLYDSTAPNAVEELVAGLQGYLTNPVDRWFSLLPGSSIDDLSGAEQDEVLDWLEEAANQIFKIYTGPKSFCQTSINECLMDTASLGTGIMSQEWDAERGGVFFQAFPLAACYLKANFRGEVDTLFRELPEMDKQMLVDAYGERALPDRVLSGSPNTKYRVIHAVMPRRHAEAMIGARGDKKPVASYHFILGPGEGAVVRQSGYDSFPYHVARWVKLAQEVYGRSPARKALPDIRVLNQMERANLVAMAKIADPPVLVQDDSVILPLKTSPGSLIYYNSGAEPPAPFLNPGRIELSLDVTNQKRDAIRSAFYADWVRMEKAKLEMTATEVMDRRDEKLRLIAPVLGRLNSEWLGPMVLRTLRLLLSNGRLPEMPQVLSGMSIEVEHVSSASKAQMGVNAMNINRYFAEVSQLAAVRPEVLDAINLDAAVETLGVYRGIPRHLLLNSEEREGLRRDRDAQKQLAQLQAGAAAAVDVTQGIKNVADAQRIRSGV